MSTIVENSLRCGDRIWEMADQYAARINASELATDLREMKADREQFFGYVTAMYPIVVGFNRCLIRSLAKIDHVREPKLIRYLCEQLREEQDHNGMWRRKMERYGLDHEKLYTDLENYLDRYSEEELDRMTTDLILVLREDQDNVSPGIFPDAPLPEAVIGLYHHLYMTATDPTTDYWIHFACQSAVEYIIYDVVSTSVYPGVAGNDKLNQGKVTLTWWQEHARQGSEGTGKRSDEEKHLAMAKIGMNKEERPNEIVEAIIEKAEDAMRLFAGTAICHDEGKSDFSIAPYHNG